MSWLENLRKWIDGEDEIDDQGEAKPRSKWDDFLVRVAREVEACMQREMFTPPGGPTYVPREYLIFIHPDDDAEWQGEKREGLERGLHHVLTERARELAGNNEFQTRTLTLELRVDPSLEKGKFRIQHVWDTAAEKTMVKPRKRAGAAAQAGEATQPARQDSESGDAVPGSPGAPGAPDDEATVVRPRKPATPAFSLSIRRVPAEGAEAAANVRSFYKDEISIGRGSRQVEVDLKLEGDLEVSRQHATLTRSKDGSFTLACRGANSIAVGEGREIATGQIGPVAPGEKIAICSYELTIQ
jgi:hypothetical protein